MARLSVRRLSAAAPALPTAAPLIVFDGVCGLCTGFVRWVLERDRQGLFRFTPAQGPLGQALYRDLELDPVRFETSLLIVDGVAYGRWRGTIEIVRRLGGAWRAAALLRLAPDALGGWLYDRVAARRYAVFGRLDAAWRPPPEWADRVL